ncbi:MAG: 4'-phosphopantetheinyl transferase family protein [Acidobacteriota bacterium]
MSLPPYITRLLASPWGTALWCVSLDVALSDSDSAMLDAAEQARAARFRFERDARRYRVSHVALRQMLAHAMGEPDPARITFTQQAHGKPVLAHSAWHFNLSHSGDRALIGISASHPIGVDLEEARPLPDGPDLAEQHFSEAEYAAYLAAPADQREATFLRCWTRKEACLKATGSGLVVAARGVDVGVHSGVQGLTVADTGGRDAPGGTRLCQVEVMSLPACAAMDGAYAALARVQGLKP